ncbi:MAG: metal-dependent hydrolase [Alicyclobacillus sp.]|nr:metal-dependent hydrolase [Alicyclobacillus sp.]
MKIRRLGHAMFEYTTKDGHTYLVDPFFDLNPGCPESFLSADHLATLGGVFLTHGHFDHVSGLERVKQANPDVMVVCQYDLAMLLLQQGLSNVFPINFGGTAELPGVAASMVVARHTSSFGETEGRPVYAGEAAGYVFAFTGDHTVYHSGDTTFTLDMKLIQDFYHPDVAVLSASGHFTMGPREAAYAVRNLLDVRYVIPSHTFPTKAEAPRPDVWETLTANVPPVQFMMGKDRELAEHLAGYEKTQVVVLGYGEEWAW